MAASTAAWISSAAARPAPAISEAMMREQAKP